MSHNLLHHNQISPFHNKLRSEHVPQIVPTKIFYFRGPEGYFKPFARAFERKDFFGGSYAALKWKTVEEVKALLVSDEILKETAMQPGIDDFIARIVEYANEEPEPVPTVQ